MSGLYRCGMHTEQPALPEAGISESGNIRSLHLGSTTVQSSMNLDYPSELVLAYSRAMMGWLLFTEYLPAHITQIGLGGGSFARWIDAHLPTACQTVVEINPQVICIARSMFALPPEGVRFNIVEADGAEYIQTLNGSTDVILVDGFDGLQIADALVETVFFKHCLKALSANGIMVSNWWSGDYRYRCFVERLGSVFGGRVLELPAESHGNIAVMAFVSRPKKQHFDLLEKRADVLTDRYGLDFKQMLCALKANNRHNGRYFDLQR